MGPFLSLCLGLLPWEKEIIVVKLLGLNVPSFHLFSISPICSLDAFPFSLPSFGQTVIYSSIWNYKWNYNSVLLY